MAIEGVWTEEAFVSLEASSEAAAEVGLNVWATLHPPSGDPRIARMTQQERRELYLTTVERFARIAREHPSFVAFTCDDFDYNLSFFSPAMMAETAEGWRAVCPRLMLLPLLYYRSTTPELFASRRSFMDGIVFHFRADSYPYAAIPQYDPRRFEMYGDVMRYELSRVRKIAGPHPVVCGIYIRYYRSGWGVLTPGGQRHSHVGPMAHTAGMDHEYMPDDPSAEKSRSSRGFCPAARASGGMAWRRTAHSWPMAHVRHGCPMCRTASLRP